MSARRTNPRQLPAFTLLEVLAAITIISILIGISVIAFKSVGNSAKAKQTAVTFETLKTMMELMRKVDSTLINADQILPAPGMIEDPSVRDEPNRNQVLYTRYIMSRMMRVPDVRKMVEQMQTSQILGRVTLGASTNAFSPAGTYYVSDRVTDAGVTYLCVKFQTPNYDATSTPTVTAPAGNPSFVDESLFDATPVLLDGWGNPILAVPNRGLMHARLSTDVLASAWAAGTIYDSNVPDVANPSVVSATPDPTFAAYAENFVCIGNHTSDSVPGSTKNEPIDRKWAASVTAPLGKPFFVSAGPDGVVGYENATVKGADDNVYSFEN